jgi:hypothetical protein
VFLCFEDRIFKNHIQKKETSLKQLNIFYLNIFERTPNYCFLLSLHGCTVEFTRHDVVGTITVSLRFAPLHIFTAVSPLIAPALCSVLATVQSCCSDAAAVTSPGAAAGAVEDGSCAGVEELEALEVELVEFGEPRSGAKNK